MIKQFDIKINKHVTEILATNDLPINNFMSQNFSSDSFMNAVTIPCDVASTPVSWVQWLYVLYDEHGVTIPYDESSDYPLWWVMPYDEWIDYPLCGV